MKYSNALDNFHQEKYTVPCLLKKSLSLGIEDIYWIFSTKEEVFS